MPGTGAPSVVEIVIVRVARAAGNAHALARHHRITIRAHAQRRRAIGRRGRRRRWRRFRSSRLLQFHIVAHVDFSQRVRNQHRRRVIRYIQHYAFAKNLARQIFPGKTLIPRRRAKTENPILNPAQFVDALPGTVLITEDSEVIPLLHSLARAKIHVNHVARSHLPRPVFAFHHHRQWAPVPRREPVKLFIAQFRHRARRKWPRNISALERLARERDLRCGHLRRQRYHLHFADVEPHRAHRAPQRGLRVEPRIVRRVLQRAHQQELIAHLHPVIRALIQVNVVAAGVDRRGR